MARILNIAHRGFTRDYPDNTIEAFEAAIQLPVDGIECDVRETADGHFVMFHDDEIEGKEIAGMRLEEIRELRLADGVRIPTLEETLVQCRDRVLLNIEIKQMSSLSQFIELIRSRTDAAAVALTSFDRDLVFRLAQIAPDFRRGVITATEENFIAMAKETASDLIAPYCRHVNGEVVSQARTAGLLVFVWGCSDIGETREALETGIDGIVTDFPDETAKEIARLADQ